MSSHNISLPTELSSYVTEQVSTGKYGSVSELFRSALRTFQIQQREQDLRIQALKLAIDEGEKAISEGRTTTLNSESEIESFFENIGSQVTTEANA